MKIAIKQTAVILFAMTILMAFSAVNASQLQAQEVNKQQLEPLKFRYIGPVGNRIISAAGIPADPLTYYVGAASGGIWKTENGGLDWKPIFDDKPVHAIGALAVAPSDPEVIYAGTGESSIRSNVSVGDGVWKS
ncbi:MAG: sialidase, partial [Candidatus Aminicenantes bacterium]|nr:sialidase [Candidatus Aminicenantes bacterium]